MIAAFSYSIWGLQSDATGPSPADCASVVNHDTREIHASAASNTYDYAYSWAAEASRVHPNRPACVASHASRKHAAAASQVNP